MGLSLDNAAGNHAGINLECFYIDKATLLCIASYICTYRILLNLYIVFVYRRRDEVFRGPCYLRLFLCLRFLTHAYERHLRNLIVRFMEIKLDYISIVCDRMDVVTKSACLDGPLDNTVCMEFTKFFLFQFEVRKKCLKLDPFG